MAKVFWIFSSAEILKLWPMTLILSSSMGTNDVIHMHIPTDMVYRERYHPLEFHNLQFPFRPRCVVTYRNHTHKV